MSSVGAELPRQMARLANHLVHNRDLPAPVVDNAIAAIFRASEAIARQDVIAHLQSFEELKALGA